MKATVVETLRRQTEIEVSPEEYAVLTSSCMQQDRECAALFAAMEEKVRLRAWRALADVEVDLVKLSVNCGGYAVVDEGA